MLRQDVSVQRALSSFPILAALATLSFALALRWAWFGDPIAGLDEQFYLLVGDRLRHGVLPFVDIWDRKPAGLFLIYAAATMAPGDGILASQIIATLCLAVTGWLAALIARGFVPPAAAIAAGLAVVGYGVLLGAGFGEPPIFHDMLTVAAVWLLLPIVTGRRSTARALAAMLLCGVAITIKTSAVFEGVALGLVLAVAEWRCDRRTWCLLPRLALYVAAGAVPMLAIVITYLAIGKFDLFWFANVTSILRKSGGGSPDSVAGLVGCLLLLSPLIGLVSIGARGLAPPARWLVLGWTAGCVLSFVAIGFFAFHYALPLVTPLAILAAPALGRWGGRLTMIACGAIAVATASLATTPARDRADIAAVLRLLPSSVRTQCLLVYEGPSILYHLSGACLPGRYVFPGHFTAPGEADALERPPAVILAETLARRPAAIVTVAGRGATRNDRILAATLERGYRLRGRQSIRLYGNERATAEVWERR